MNKILKNFIVSLFILAFFIPILAKADGGVISTEIKQPEGEIELPTQEAVIIWEKGEETLSLSTGIKVKELSNLAWMVPVPSEVEPTIKKANPDYFGNIRYLFSEIEMSFSKKGSELSPFMLAVLVLALVIPLYGLFKKRENKNILIVGLILYMFWAYAIASMLFLSLGAREVHQAGEDLNPIEVVQTKKVGVYDTIVLKADDAEYMVNWLNERGYNISDKNIPVLEDYCSQDNFYFIVNKIREEALSSEDTQEKIATPLEIKFQPEKPFYPLKISSINKGETLVNTYFISKNPVSDLSDTLSIKKVRRIDKVVDKFTDFSENQEVEKAMNDILSYNFFGKGYVATWLQHKGKLKDLEKDATFGFNSKTCKELPEAKWLGDLDKDQCYKRLGIFEEDASLCAKIDADFRADECYYEVAIDTKNAELCNEIENEFDRDSCKEEIEETIMRGIRTPTATTRAFYKNWINFEGSPMHSKIYEDSDLITENFVNQIETVKHYDPILCAQDVPSSFDVKLLSKNATSATVQVQEAFGGNFNQVEVDLVKKDKDWFIDNVECSL